MTEPIVSASELSIVLAHLGLNSTMKSVHQRTAELGRFRLRNTPTKTEDLDALQAVEEQYVLAA